MPNQNTSPNQSIAHNRDSIFLQGLVFYGYHGVMPEENKVGCRFLLNVTCDLDLSSAALSDELDDTISYADLFETIREAFGEKQFKLLEAVAQHIIDRLFAAYPQLNRIKIRVSKLEAPIAISVGEFGVKLVRERKNG